MSITSVQINSAAIETDYAGYAPIVVSGVTDRYPFTGSTRQSQTITGMADSSGLLRLTVADSSDFLEDDTIQISGATSDFERYNGRHRIYEIVSSTQITIVTPWVSASTGDTGTLYRLNESLQVRIRIKDANTGDSFGTVDARVSTDGAFSADIGGIVRTAFNGFFSLTAGEIPTTNAVQELEFEIEEMFQSADYTTRRNSIEYTSISFFAHNTTDLANMITGTELQNCQHQTVLRAGTKIIYHAIVDDTVAPNRLSFTPNTGSATVINLPTITDGHIGHVYEVASGAD